MALKEFHCLHCGAPLDGIRSDGTYHCTFCDNVFKDDSLQKEIQTIGLMFSGMLSKQQEEQIANVRHNLYDSVHEKYLDSKKILGYCQEMKKLLPDDFQANFYEIANSGTPIEINRFLDRIDVLENDVYAFDVVKFMIKTMDSKSALSVKSFIERAKSFGVFTSEQYTDFITKVEDEAEKLEEGIYSTILPRDVFLAYSSSDMNRVNEITDFLEANEITCFTSVRNLRHGRGAKENYISEIQSAIRHCKCVVFLSSENSRRLACDALRIELPYIQEQQPKIGRIEYILDDYGPATSNSAKKILESFFNGLEYCRTLDDLHTRVLKYTTGIQEEKIVEKPVASNKKIENKQKDNGKTFPSFTISDFQIKGNKTFEINGTILVKYNGNDSYIEIPEGVTDIADSAFSGSRVKGVYIPETVFSIGENAFEGCQNLLVVYLPSSVQQIKMNAFKNCNSVVRIYTPLSEEKESWSKYWNNGYRVLWNSKYSYQRACDEVKHYAEEREKAKDLYDISLDGTTLLKYKAKDCNPIIPDGIETIAAGAFSYCMDLYKVTIPESVTIIENGAFLECTKLYAVYISNLTAWCSISFANDTSNPLCYAHNLYLNGKLVKELTIPDTIKEIKDKSFYMCSCLEEVRIPKSVNSIGQSAFQQCTSLSRIHFSEGLKRIGQWAFLGCKNLTKIVIPDSVESIGSGAFYNCYNVEGIFISNLNMWCKIAFPLKSQYKSNLQYDLYLNGELLTELTIPNTIKEIKNECFMGCRCFKKVIIPDSVTSIGSFAFSGCSNLSHVTLSNKLEKIESKAFEYCNELKEIFIPESVKKMDDFVFLSSYKVIKCAAKKKPDGWDENWDVYKDGNIFTKKRCKVIWGYKG